MKKLFIAVIALLYSFIGASMVFAAGDTWTQKADFGGTVRYSTVSFSIGDKGYIGTGYGYTPQTGTQRTKDFWEYDPANDTWTQKADFGGAARTSAAGFSIGDKGYIGTGNVPPTSNVKDFWEYDQALNVWTRKADFGGGNRIGAVGFSIGNKGYIGWGINSSANYKDFWEYDPATDIWTKKADFGGTARSDVVGFSIGNKGYAGTGLYYNYSNSSSTYYKDFWEYDPAKDIWIQKADFGGAARYRAAGFSIGNNGYIGVGKNSSNQTDFWQYDPDTNAWTKKADFGGGSRVDPAVFVIGYRGYVGTGIAGLATYTKDFWEYEPADMPANTSVTMTFEGLTNGEEVRDYYNGGYGYDRSTGLPKSGPGPNYGVTFPEGRVGAGENISYETTGIWRGEPTPHTAIGFDAYAWMNVESGFTGSFSFYYGNPNGDSKIYIYDGINRTGNLLATLDLPRTIQDTDGAFLMVYASVSFSGIARSVDFSEEQGSCVMDDITLGAPIPPVADTTPDQFIFNYETGVSLNTMVTSNTITVSGINAAAPISITGGKYSINGGTYTNASGTVNNGDKVTVQQTSSDSYLTTTVATLTIGGVSDTFSVTTKEESIITLNPVADKTTLWPPNNKMVAVTIRANASDSAGGPVKLAATVSCNELARLGRDWTTPVINQKTGVISLSLRATRLGSRTGRIYTITITATGTEGNSATKAVTITVPHDQGNDVGRSR